MYPGIVLNLSSPNAVIFGRGLGVLSCNWYAKVHGYSWLVCWLAGIAELFFRKDKKEEGSSLMR